MALMWFLYSSLTLSLVKKASGSVSPAQSMYCTHDWNLSILKDRFLMSGVTPSITVPLKALTRGVLCYIWLLTLVSCPQQWKLTSVQGIERNFEGTDLSLAIDRSPTAQSAVFESGLASTYAGIGRATNSISDFLSPTIATRILLVHASRDLLVCKRHYQLYACFWCLLDNGVKSFPVVFIIDPCTWTCFVSYVLPSERAPLQQAILVQEKQHEADIHLAWTERKMCLAKAYGLAWPIYVYLCLE